MFFFRGVNLISWIKNPKLSVGEKYWKAYVKGPEQMLLPKPGGRKLSQFL